MINFLNFDFLTDPKSMPQILSWQRLECKLISLKTVCEKSKQGFFFVL